MATSRRRFLKGGTLVALFAGFSGGLARTVLGREMVVSAGNRVAGLRKADFDPHIGSRFHVQSGTKRVELTLATVTNLKRPASKKNKEGFSLLFDAPTAAKLPQDTYLIEHEQLGTFMLLMVPVVSRKKQVRRYEVIINRIYS